eukprot:1503296-Rhodomonas_salina.4
MMHYAGLRKVDASTVSNDTSGTTERFAPAGQRAPTARFRRYLAAPHATSVPGVCRPRPVAPYDASAVARAEAVSTSPRVGR